MGGKGGGRNRREKAGKRRGRKEDGIVAYFANLRKGGGRRAV